MRHPDIGQLAVVDEPEHFQIRELAQRRDPLIAEFGRDDVERLNRFDVPEMLEEIGVVRIDLAMIVRSRVGNGEVHELQRVEDRKLAARSFLQAFWRGVDLLHFAGRQLHGASDGFDMRVKFSGSVQLDRVLLKRSLQFDILGGRDGRVDVAQGFDIGERGGRLRGERGRQSAEEQTKREQRAEERMVTFHKVGLCDFTRARGIAPREAARRLSTWRDKSGRCGRGDGLRAACSTSP